MNFNDAITEIRSSWEQILPRITGYAKTNVNGHKSYICPFCGHGSHGDGMTFNPGSKDKSGLKCFGCDFSGDIIDLYEKKENTDLTGAVNALAEIIGITIDKEEKPKKRPAERTTEEPAKEVHENYSAYYSECRERLKESPTATSYLQARGISLETAEKYWIGFDPAADPAGKGHKTPRLIMPATAEFYTARRIDDAKECRYINAPGNTALFHEKALYDSDTVFITEGMFDAYSFLECGAEAVALNSVSNVDLLLQKLKQKRTTAKLVLCLDNDNAGKKAAEKLKNGLKSINIGYVYFNMPEEIHDINAFLTTDRDGLQQAIRAAIDDEPHDSLSDFIDAIQSESFKPYSTGLNFFDDMMGGGLVKQSLLILMAAPGAGKTALCQQLAESLADKGQPVIYLNLEMSREQMLARAISHRLAREKKWYTQNNILQGYSWTDTQRAEITKILTEYRRGAYQYIKYNPDEVGTELDTIKSYLTSIGNAAAAAGTPAPVVVIDYLHLITSKNRLEIQELIKQAVTALKDYAKTYSTNVIAIAATNRASTNRITIESARDSSNIEYTGDYILGLDYFEAYKDSKDGKIEPERLAEIQQGTYRQMVLRVLKNRHGTPGRSANLQYRAANNIFYGADEFVEVDPGLTPFPRKNPNKTL